jgi:excisionase family DNA binding protein
MVFDDEFLTREELADRLKIAPKTVSKWVRAGRLPPPYRFGRLRRWYWPGVMAFIYPELMFRPKPRTVGGLPTLP